MSQAIHQPAAAHGLGRPVVMSEFHEHVGPDDVEQLHADDRKAAGMVAGLMVSIFTAGIIMYLIIAFMAMAGGS